LDAVVEVTVTLPLYVPGGRPLPEAETVTTAGVVAEEIDALSQLPPVAVWTDTATSVGESLDTAIDCIALVLTFCVNTKLTCDGDALSTGADRTLRVTGTVNGLFPAPADVKISDP
jgi:hypothetical protein